MFFPEKSWGKDHDMPLMGLWEIHCGDPIKEGSELGGGYFQDLYQRIFQVLVTGGRLR